MLNASLRLVKLLHLRPMKSIKLTLFLIVVVIGFSRCTTDVDLNAPYSPFTVVFGLLDPGQDTQYVKINKTWLGAGNNFDYALIRDSSEYDFSEFEATIGRYNNGSLAEEWVLDSITLDDKDSDGLFFSPEYTAYYFVNEDGLNQTGESEWRINIDFIDKEDVSASTTLIEYPQNNSNITQPPAGQGPNFKFGMAAITGDGTHYNDFDFKWTSAENAGRYELSLDFHYIERVYEDIEHTILLSESYEVLNWFIGSIEAPITGVEQLSKEVNWEAFYRMLQSRLDADPFISREVGNWDADEQLLSVFDVKLTIANDDLDTYLDVNAPVTGIIQERPEYTNVTNGLGLFASRGQQIAYGYGVTNNSMHELVIGEFTNELGFCSGNPFSDDACD